jgi:glycosyltransferase involved in cell wall biosynthesis
MLQGRHPTAGEIEHFAAAMRAGHLDRLDLLTGQFAHMMGEDARIVGAGLDTSRFLRLGTEDWVTVSEWRERLDRAEPVPRATQSRFPLRPRTQEVEVSVICSLWRGGNFIERYLDNITSQTIFEDRCELIVIDAASDQGEGEVVRRYQERFPGRIVYHRMPYRAGIYVAWNVGVGLARGRFLTNANLDDLRRQDSLEQQATALDALPYVDLGYQDHVYSADDSVDFERAAHAGVVSDLPHVTPHVMLKTNPPHNGPMWRADLHDRIGLFDEGYRTAGDYEFWLRAVSQGATFYKLNDPTVLYYFNPEGLSTARNSRGIYEGREAQGRHGEALLPRASVEPPGEFLKRLGLKHWPEGAGTRYAVVQTQMRRLAARHAPARKEDA